MALDSHAAEEMNDRLNEDDCSAGDPLTILTRMEEEAESEYSWGRERSQSIEQYTHQYIAARI